MKTFNLFTRILLFGAFIFFFYFFLAARYGEFFPNAVTNLLFTEKDKYMDFFNQILYARDLNPYIKGPGFDSPLFLYVIHYIAGFFPASANSPLEFRYMTQGKILFAGYIAFSLAIFAAAFNELLSNYKIEIKNRLLFYIAFILSYPVIFAVDRGNYVLLTAAILSMFVVKFIKKRTFTAAILLGIAAALKYYPAFFVIIFLVNRKWKETLVFALTAAFLFLFCLGQFQGGLFLNLKMLLKNLAYHQSAGLDSSVDLLAHNTSIYMLFDIPAVALLRNSHDKIAAALFVIHGKIKYLAYLLIGTVSLACFIPRMKAHDIFLLISSGVLLFPLVAGDYMIPIIALPAVLWILSEPDNYVIPWLAGLYMVSKRYIAFYNGALASITVQSLISPLILLAIAAYIIWLRGGYLTERFKGADKVFPEKA